MSRNIDQLGTIAAKTAMKAAAEYFRVHKVSVDDYGAATELIRHQCKTALPEALNDAKDALDIGLGAAAETTFLASMRLAGIAAAKQYVNRYQVTAA